MATETSPPYNHTKSSNSTGQWHQNLGTHAPNGNQFPVGRNASAGRTAGSAAASSNTANYSNFQQDSFSRMTGVEKTDEDGIRYGFNAPQYAERTYGFSSSKFNSTRELTPLENRNMLMEKARKEILKKLNEWKSQPQDAQKHKVKESKKEKQRNANVGHNVNGNVESSAMKGVKKAVNASGNDVPQGDPVPESMNDRSESCFKDNEVWAAYDADDGMPRFYALISKVLSREPFKVSTKLVVNLGLADTKQEGGRASVALFGVAGFKTVFRPDLNSEKNDKVVNGGSSQKVQETKTSETAERTLKSREGGMIESEEAP
ncbi:hypothetical protein HAX54_025754 [Datura stramonium]|uniref:DUF3444 domain-containing protein n=1 Tax=Datura stramonium TaxID=4076 RepID=A0ABS8V2R1_DATST|nr:hypothetical protein [Datura stramonium]